MGTPLSEGKTARSCELVPSDGHRPGEVLRHKSADDERSREGRSAEYELRTSDGTGSKNDEGVCWKVKVNLDDLITRQIWCDDKPWDPKEQHWEPEGVIWPTWPGGSGGADDHVRLSGAPLADLQDYWSTVSNRLRDSAKWMAAGLGAALATVIGTSPLASMRDHKPSWIAVGLGLAGLIFLGLTLFLVVQVMRPQSVSFADVQRSQERRGRPQSPLYRWRPKDPLYRWKHIVESQQDLYLPCGVRCLTSLRQSMIIEEVTLMTLSRAKATSRDHEASRKLSDAQAARAARLLQLRIAAATVATVGEYYRLRYRSSWATYGGIVSSLAGTAAIVAAFTWPLS